MDALRVSWPLADHSDLRNDLAVLMYAMNRLGGHFPLVGMYVNLMGVLRLVDGDTCDVQLGSKEMLTRRV